MIRYFLIAFLLLGTTLSCNSISSVIEKQDHIIGILPYNGINKTDMDSVQQILERTYNLKVAILDHINLPESAFTTRRSSRYRADSLLHYQRRIMPDSISIIIGLTNRDISSTKMDPNTLNVKEPQHIYVDWGIFGLGELNGKSCIVSTNRLRKGVNTGTYFTRLMRISTHEVGHVLGLPHCPTPKCVMNDANESIKTIDKSTGDLCDKCWTKIR
jgi:archaemetzincin